MKSKKGFTLLEIVIALAILAIGLVGILSLFPVGFEASRRWKNLSRVDMTIWIQLIQILCPQAIRLLLMAVA